MVGSSSQFPNQHHTTAALSKVRVVVDPESVLGTLNEMPVEGNWRIRGKFTWTRPEHAQKHYTGVRIGQGTMMQHSLLAMVLVGRPVKRFFLDRPRGHKNTFYIFCVE